MFHIEFQYSKRPVHLEQQPVYNSPKMLVLINSSLPPHMLARFIKSGSTFCFPSPSPWTTCPQQRYTNVFYFKFEGTSLVLPCILIAWENKLNLT